ncbi:OmpH family outer membrane protein [Roseovarius sp. EL26]|uniref:OmpH family outer membrane protein n=1 Tax=Roseovarius sp. EL26 TaxID=2126672 RepID=UPI0013C40488|nr:OmpH family outer membrane protein [Roseovarius sp. EL26]
MIWQLLRILCLSILLTGTAKAQTIGVIQSELLVLDTERLLAETLFGKKMTAEYQAAREKLSTQNRQIEAELEAEEKLLTELRAQSSTYEFKSMADAFDAKVQELRRTSDLKVRELERNRDLAPVAFMRTVEPILVELMVETGGAVILDKRSVLFRRDVVDITSLAITRIDQKIGDGTGFVVKNTKNDPENAVPQE